MGETPAEMTTPVADNVAQVSRTSERRYFRILDIAFDGIISIDGAQRIIDFNQGAERIFGHGADEMIGKSIDILLPPRFREQHGGHIRNFATSAETKRMMAARGNIVGVRKDGSEFPAEASISKSMAGGEPEFTVILRDITDRMKVQDSLAESEARYRSLVEFSPDAILVQIDGRIVFANPAAAIVYGAQSPEDLVDIAILDLLHPYRVRRNIDDTSVSLLAFAKRFFLPLAVAYVPADAEDGEPPAPAKRNASGFDQDLGSVDL